MPLTVKVQFKDKLYKLANNTTTLQQVHHDMQQRFPNLEALQYFYRDTLVTDLPAVLAAAAREGLSSVKLVAKKTSSDLSRLNEVSVIVESERNDSSVISLLAEESKKTEKTMQIRLPHQFYVCYNCQGRKTVKSMSVMQLCPICKGAGQLEQTHKYVTRLRELYLKHFRGAEQGEMGFENLSQEPVPQRKSSITGVDKTYEVIVRETTKKETVEVGKVFSMRFQIKNTGPSWEGRRVEIIQMGQTQGKTLSALKNGQTMEVELGPFVCSNEGVLEKTYVLCFREGEELIRFGHKFGFAVRGFKPKPVRKMVSNQRQRIRDLKMLSGSSKSEEYLSLKLKSMGIDVMNLQLEDEVILDVIRQFK